MKLLDLFCGAGGASVGYARAFPNAEIVGVDIYPQPRYPFQFYKGDALMFCHQYGSAFDIIHASPPCQLFSSITPARSRSHHKNLIPLTRAVIKESNPQVYVIENVERAKKELISPITLCGAQFGLKVYRHRCFEISRPIIAPFHKPHRDKTPAANQKTLAQCISPKGFISVVGGGSRQHQAGRRDIFEYRKTAMGIDWMNRYELCQAIPPSYTHYIGQQIKENGYVKLQS